MHPHPPHADGLSELLVTLGFRGPGGAAGFRHPGSGIRARPDGDRWLALEARDPVRAPGTAGLWKPVSSGNPGRARVWRCDLPLGGGEGAEFPSGGMGPVKELLVWALEGWTRGDPSVPPPRRRTGTLGSVETHGWLRQIEAEWPEPPAPGETGGGVLAIRCEVARIPDAGVLAPGRMRWLGQAIDHAQRVFRMVDWSVESCPGIPGTQGTRVLGRVDWAGAPPEWQGRLESAGRQALVLGIRWLTPLAQVLGDPGLPLVADDLAPLERRETEPPMTHGPGPGGGGAPNCNDDETKHPRTPRSAAHDRPEPQAGGTLPAQPHRRHRLQPG